MNEHRKLYDCQDCYDEALMYTGIYDSDEVPLDKLDKFNKSYKHEYEYNHEMRNFPIKALK